jgi:hypothetical protein|tara:strand:- start:59 stop:331 length:273 start_codon:yes stop_codon:yes gene_type:complete
MNEKERIELIKNAVANPVGVASQFEGLLEELKAEELVLEHGIKHASDQEVKDEFVSLDAVEREESEDYDNDENLVDMENVSGSFLEIFGE